MNNRTLLPAVLAAIVLPLSAFADTETVDGIEWNYMVMEGENEVWVGNDGYFGESRRAVPTSTTGAITIPSRLGGHPVTCIFNDAFRDCSGLKSVTIPTSVTSIWQWAFRGCIGLTSINIPSSVTCIKHEVFEDCSGLTFVTIGNGATSIEGSAFKGCSSLMSFSVGVDNPNYSSVSGLLLSKDKRTLISGVNGNVTIPDSVTSIGDSAFRGRSGLMSVTIPNSVRSIESAAFFGCSGLTSVTIPDSVTNIGDNVFHGCDGLTTVNLPKRFEGNTDDMGIPGVCAVVFVDNSFNNDPPMVDPPADNPPVVAPQSPAATYKVAFNANGGKLPKGKKMAAQTFRYGTAAKLHKSVFTRSGYEFIGWAKSKKGVVAYKNAQRVKNLRADGRTMTLYAKWAKKTYKVAFYRNGGKGKMAAQTMTYGKAKKLSKNKFKRKGYTFKGWAKSKALAKQGTVAYKNKAKVKNLVVNGKTVKLYAVWKKAVNTYSDWRKGLVAYYPLNGTFEDASGNGHTFTVRSGGAFCRDRFGNVKGAVSFNGNRQYFQGTGIMLKKSFTVACWFQTSVSKYCQGSASTAWRAGNALLFPTHGGGNAGVGLSVGIDGLAVTEHGSYWLPTQLDYSKAIGSGWNHVCMVVANNTSVRLYLNGKLVSSGTLSGKVKYFSPDLGGDCWGYYAGKADDLCVYDRALSASEIFGVFKGTSSGAFAYAVQ